MTHQPPLWTDDWAEIADSKAGLDRQPDHSAGICDPEPTPPRPIVDVIRSL